MHKHEHKHEHNHTHEYGHEDGLIHNHAHEHGHDQHTADPSTVAALLTYLLEHNDHHLQELYDIRVQLQELGYQPASEAVIRAYELYRQGNAELARANELM